MLSDLTRRKDKARCPDLLLTPLYPMETSIKLWVEKIQGKPLPSLSLIRDFDYLRTLLHRLEPSFFQASSTSTYDGLLD